MKFLTPLLLLMAGLFACSSADQPANDPAASAPTTTTERIISLDGTLTELLFDLGYGDRVVGVDVTTSYPAAANAVPKLGHVSKLNVEAILQLKPTLIFVNADARENPALQTLADANVDIISVPTEATLDNAARAAAVLGKKLGVPANKLADYTQRIAADKLTLEETLSRANQAKPRVLFIYARGAKQLMVAGADTEAAAMIELAGGQNAITSFSDFKPLTPEALVEAAPEVILMFESGLASLDGKAGLANIPGISQTPAYKDDRVIAMDGHYLLGFGPRAARAANELATALHHVRTK